MWRWKNYQKFFMQDEKTRWKSQTHHFLRCFYKFIRSSIIITAIREECQRWKWQPDSTVWLPDWDKQLIALLLKDDENFVLSFWRWKYKMHWVVLSTQFRQKSNTELEQILHLEVDCSDFGPVRDRGSLPYLYRTDLQSYPQFGHLLYLRTCLTS